MKKNILIVYSLLFILFFSGCIEKYDYKDCSKPIYLSYEKLRSNYPVVKEPKEIEKAGKIYVYDDILLINEKNRGIHIIDNRVKETPIGKSFIEIPGNIDLAVKDGYLYVDSYTDLVVLDIRDIDNIKKVHQIEDIFPYYPYQSLSQEDLNKDRCSYDKDRGFIIGYR